MATNDRQFEALVDAVWRLLKRLEANALAAEQKNRRRKKVAK